jgi:anti-sigma B factor antagonist
MVETAVADEVATISVRGDLDDAAIEEVARAIADAVKDARMEMVLDLGDVAFIDSAGLEFIIRAGRHVAKRGGTLRVSNPTAQIRRLLAVCGILDLDLSARPVFPRPTAPRQALALAADAESRMYGA